MKRRADDELGFIETCYVGQKIQAQSQYFFPFAMKVRRKKADFYIYI